MRLKSMQVRRGPDGMPLGYDWNELLHNVKPYYMVPNNADNNPNNPEEIVIPANAWSPWIPMSIDAEGPFEGSMLMHDDAAGGQAACLVELLDTEIGHKITGRPCHVDTILGSGLRPSILPESLWLPRRQAIQFRAFDLSAQENNIRPIVGGQRFWLASARDKRLDTYAEERMFRRRYVRPYVCPLDKDVELTGGAVGTDHYFTQGSQGHFEVFKILYHSTDEFKFKIEDESGRSLTENWVHCNGGMGTAQYPFITYGTWLIAASGKVTFTLEDLSGEDNKIYITLMGRMLMV